ncbi:MAG: RHS repeat protein, partial [bacterium]|nr:RHS repeat protein [bacterium]
WGKRSAGVADRNDRQVIWYEYGDDNSLQAARDLTGRRVEYHRNDRNLTVVDAAGNTTEYRREEEEGQKPLVTIDAAGRKTEVTLFDYQARKVVDSKGEGYSFSTAEYEPKEEIYSEIETTSGKVKKITYDLKNGRTKRVEVNGRLVKEITGNNYYLEIEDEKGNVTTKKYHAREFPKSIEYPDGSMVSFEYDGQYYDEPASMTDQRGVETRYEYDDRGNLLKKTEAAETDSERITNYTYGDYDQLLKASTSGDDRTPGAEVVFTYDDVTGVVASITDPLGAVTLFAGHDAMGNPHEVTDARENIWRFQYDELGNLTSSTDPLEHKTSYEYDGVGNLTAVVNAALKRFEYEYDDHNNLIRALDPYRNETNISYNFEGQPTRVKDAMGRTSSFEYDEFTRLTTSVDGAGNKIVYHYDDDQASHVSSRLPVRIDYPTFTRDIKYDVMGRVVEESTLNGTHRKSYEYDIAGAVLS